MPTVSDNFLGYALNARATSGTQGYTGSNRADAPAVNGWNAVEVQRFDASSSNFAAQAYTDGNGNFNTITKTMEEPASGVVLSKSWTPAKPPRVVT